MGHPQKNLDEPGRAYQSEGIYHNCESYQATRVQAPLLIKGPNVNYILWQTQDLEGLVRDLPGIHNGVSRWIREFEEKTQGKKLAIGDIKAVLGRMIG